MIPQILIDQYTAECDIKFRLKDVEGLCNNETTRQEIHAIVTEFFNGVTYTDYTVVCDESNNTEESLDQDQLNVDVWVRPPQKYAIDIVIHSDGSVTYPKESK